MAKVNRIWIYVGVVTVGIAGWILTEPEPPVTTEKTTAKRSTARGATAKQTVFTKEDEQAQFARVNDLPGSAFSPLVSRKNAKSSNNNLLPNQIPPSFVDGDATWFFTGSVVVNTVPSALVESTARNEGVYLKVGERFKQFTVTSISQSTLTLAGPNGSTAKLVIIENRPIVDIGTSASLAPLDPLTGPISINASKSQPTKAETIEAKVEEPELEVKKATKTKVALTPSKSVDNKDNSATSETENK